MFAAVVVASDHECFHLQLVCVQHVAESDARKQEASKNKYEEDQKMEQWLKKKGFDENGVYVGGRHGRSRRGQAPVNATDTPTSNASVYAFGQTVTNITQGV